MTRTFMKKSNGNKQDEYYIVYDLVKNGERYDFKNGNSKVITVIYSLGGNIENIRSNMTNNYLAVNNTSILPFEFDSEIAREVIEFIFEIGIK